MVGTINRTHSTLRIPNMFGIRALTVHITHLNPNHQIVQLLNVSGNQMFGIQFSTVFFCRNGTVNCLPNPTSSLTSVASVKSTRFSLMSPSHCKQDVGTSPGLECRDLPRIADRMDNRKSLQKIRYNLDAFRGWG